MDSPSKRGRRGHGLALHVSVAGRARRCSISMKMQIGIAKLGPTNAATDCIMINDLRIGNGVSLTRQYAFIEGGG